MEHQKLVYKKGIFRTEEDMYDHIEDHRSVNDSSASEWSVLHEELDVVSGKSFKEKHIYSSYQYAVMDIGQQFKIDFDKYKEYLSSSERKRITNSFMDSLNDEKLRRPHYLIKGTYFDKNGKTCFFEAKAEIEGQLVRSKYVDLERFAKDNEKDAKEKSNGVKKKIHISLYSNKKEKDNENLPDLSR